MQLIRRYDRRLDDGCVLTIGSFEALHIGHQAVIQRSKELAQQKGVPAAVMMFEPLPSEFFGGAQRRIYRLAKRLRILQELDLDMLICLRFCQSLADISADEFIREILVNKFRVQSLVIGQDFCFGKDRIGNQDMLQEYGERHGFSVEIPDTVLVGQQRVSSTHIKELLMDGDFDQAQEYLGRRFTMEGRVVAGDGRGAALGFATANIAYGNRPPPLQGVLAVELWMDGKMYPAVANAGMRPTVDGKRYQIEAHIFNFNEQIYGRKVRINPLLKLRDEQPFQSIEELKQAIARDVAAAQQVFEPR